MKLAILFLLLSTVIAAQTSGCHRGSLDADGHLIYVEVPCASLPVPPDAPSTVVRDGGVHRPGLFAGRRWTDPPLRNPFASKTFDAAFLVYGMSSLADAAITHHRAGRTYFTDGTPCFEQDPELSLRPTNAELWTKHGIEFGAVLGLNWIAARYAWLPISWGAAGYGTVVHARGAYSWRGCN